MYFGLFGVRVLYARVHPIRLPTIACALAFLLTNS